MIDLQKISVAFGDKQVFHDFSFRFEEKKHYALFGPSGCGKTTLLRVIAGLQKPDSGEVQRQGDLRMAFCFQEERLLPWYTIRKNVALALPNEIQQNKEKASRLAQALLERVGLGEEGNSYPAALSGGMK